MNGKETVPNAPELAWFKSSYSSGAGGECVEVAACPGVVRVRDSKDTTLLMLTLQPKAWNAFVGFAAESGAV
ncbi:DUF397 domain-containing protein [Streptomyces lunaelactis]|uniref:DUF397 domain-containing protein n=1 Tax=Streptomyces lunaelactis TaxID=1535768 RepID=UPI00158575AA|nr:DUF397 domain-containing protein [Streptomyces lunaelactis]NUK10307.1 DUF397 domain-containing protein [Streptomyces lunaelactis]NUK36967.1 DUF397 domain-containing protein [Streptomyces lunaelactis]NUK44824.1 DUF397 domain-containing protein [Streptomyces lunaelactis]NUK60187.1 DUF397 domain-containing protein [Streptomyces lunaelactis]NUK95388.1 DUF397 domain-containing protein [Streptomyces lunaelactis]